MDYQSKTTVISISVEPWSEKTDRSLSTRFSAAHAVAVQIASRCQMDIMSITPDLSEECSIIVVYANNGHTLNDIQGSMKPVIDNRSQKYWMIQDLYEWQGLLECTVTTRGDDETWD